MNALLITPRIYDFTAFNYWLYPLIELLTADYLIKAGYNVTYINGIDYDKPRKSDLYGKSPLKSVEIPKPLSLKDVPKNFRVFGKDIKTLNKEICNAPVPDIVIIFHKMTYWYMGVFEAIELVKNNFPNTKVFIGGNLTSLLKDFYKKKNIDAELIDSFSSLKSKLNITKEIAIDSLSPKHELMMNMFNPNFISSITTFGCPFKCSYCVNSIKDNRLLYRSHEIIIDELEYSIKTYKINDIAFYDDYVVSNKKIIEILKSIKRVNSDTRFHFPNGLPVSKLIEYLNEFKTNNVTSFALGFEFQGNGKSTDKEYIELFNEINKLNFEKKNIGINVMIGLPGQTYKDAVNTINFIKEYSPGYKIKLNEYSPVPGTEASTKHKAVSLYDFIEEPLWQNNSLLGFRLDKEFDYKKIMELKVLIK